ncbi:hypothetical protein PR048_027836 [Dryococelus australis]|uniref:Uncharacterized protein n=1 Tax=Dryococelus australis TaxID=614101 RepID=A0ABQ9GHK7_9NEOP|nr:hypothetical protein PR048_027836 [Dryococelus australis]
MCTDGATVAERLARSPLTKANRAQAPAGSLDFRKWESCRTMPLVSGLSRGSPALPAPPFRRCSIFTSIFSSALKTSLKCARERRIAHAEGREVKRQREKERGREGGREKAMVLTTPMGERGVCPYLMQAIVVLGPVWAAAEEVNTGHIIDEYTEEIFRISASDTEIAHRFSIRCCIVMTELHVIGTKLARACQIKYGPMTNALQRVQHRQKITYTCVMYTNVYTGYGWFKVNEGEARRVWISGGMQGISPRKPTGQRHRPPRYPHTKIRERPPTGIAPSSLGWEASSLTTTPPRPRREMVLSGKGCCSMSLCSDAILVAFAVVCAGVNLKSRKGGRERDTQVLQCLDPSECPRTSNCAPEPGKRETRRRNCDEVSFAANGRAKRNRAGKSSDGNVSKRVNNVERGMSLRPVFCRLVWSSGNTAVIMFDGWMYILMRPYDVCVQPLDHDVQALDMDMFRMCDEPLLKSVLVDLLKENRKLVELWVHLQTRLPRYWFPSFVCTKIKPRPFRNHAVANQEPGSFPEPRAASQRIGIRGFILGQARIQNTCVYITLAIGRHDVRHLLENGVELSPSDNQCAFDIGRARVFREFVRHRDFFPLKYSVVWPHSNCATVRNPSNIAEPASAQTTRTRRLLNTKLLRCLRPAREEVRLQSECDHIARTAESIRSCVTTIPRGPNT